MRNFAFALAAVLAAALPAVAQDRVIPERRAVLTQNVDFYGSDLTPVFDISLPACLSTCLADPDCKALTYNARSSACFPKSAAGEKKPYDGAISARILATAPRILAAEDARRAELDFLRPADLRAAADQARGLGQTFVTNEWTAEQLVEAARAAEAEGNLPAAVRFTGAALNLTDAPDLWAELSRRALAVETSDYGARRSYSRMALSAAVNAYLRGEGAAVRATALSRLAEALERGERGREMIPALRLAQTLQPRLETEAALERALNLYGFRIVEHSVESDAAEPRICAEFSEPLVKAGVDYQDYVQIAAPGVAVEADGAKLCVSGVEHGARYRLTFRAGLPAETGEALAKAASLDVYVRDRSPQARFAGRGYVLPKTGEAAVPIVTVNLDKVDLTLHRVDDRNLLRAMQERMFGRPLAIWEEEDLSAQVGEQVWSGTGEVAMEINRDVTTRLPLGGIIAGLEPGVYALSARVPGQDPYDKPAAAQWFVVSDLGLATMGGADGLHVFVRGLSDALPRAGVAAQLLAVNNTVLGEAVTDAEGYARFAPGLLRGTAGSAPALVTLRDGEDFAFLSLTEAEFDLSDRGVAGRAAPPPVDVFVSTERGVYRAGETMHATILTRDSRAEAIEGLPLTAILTRPDGVEYRRETLTDSGAGGYVISADLAPSVPRGTWKLQVYTDTARPALAAQSFLVEDFVPERIDFDLALPEGAVRPGDVPEVGISARYLYGAPGAGLNIEGDLIVVAARELPQFPGFRFGLHDAPFETRFDVIDGAGTTDEAGEAVVPLALPSLEGADRPLEMVARLRLREGSGRPVERELRRPLLPGVPLIGIAPAFDGAVDEGGTAAFRVIGLGPDGAPQAMQVQWVLNRIDTRYQWYELYGDWNWEPVTRRTRVASGTLDLAAGEAGQIEAAVDWGRYELKVERVGGAYAASSVAFDAGWYVAADATQTPDVLELSLDQAQYRVGDTARLRLVPRYGGQALVTVISDRLIAMKTLAVTEGENLVELPVTDEWGPGAYVTAAVIRPMDAAAGHNPARALGLSWAPVDPGRHRLAASFDVAPEAQPRGPLDVRLKIDGIAPGETAHATIAAVDLGILNLTAFKSPDPEGHYFGQRKLSMALHDLYGRLIDGTSGRMGAVRSGGDATGANRLKAPPPTEDLVAYFSGPLTADAEGIVSARFDLPQFNGTVRLMAVAWSKTGVGQAEADVLVRDPVVVTASLPRFLAPGDRSRMLLELAHATGPVGTAALEVTSSAGLSLGGGLPATVDLAAGERRALSVPLTAGAEGTETITVALTTPGGERLTKTLTLQIRANDPEIARTTRFTLADGAAFTFDANVFAGLLPGTGHATLAAGPIARFDAPGLLEALDRYPYGCTEQIASRALPLLYFEEVARAMQIGTAGDLRERISQAITEVLANQTGSGSFGLWYPDSGDFWLDAYVTDFLSRARARGHEVPDLAFRIAMDNLRNRVNYAGDFEEGGEDIAYALMVLAREGAAAIGDLRYYADVKADAFGTPLALAQLGAALASYGDQTRADAMFRRAAKALGAATDDTRWRDDYGSALRDTAAVLTLAVEAGSDAVDRAALAARIIPANLNERPYSTQEATWSLLAANALIERAAPDSFTVNGAPAGGPLVRVLDAQTDTGEALLIANRSGNEATMTLTTFGVPSEPEPKGGKGYSIDRMYFTLDGDPVSPDAVPLNTRLVTVLKVKPLGRSAARLIVNDPLPAGFEIDNPNLIRGGEIAALDWLELNGDPQHVEFRADRFIAAMDWRSDEAFQLAYIVRAISPGAFHHPAASVEDMYRPAWRARSATGRVSVTE